MAKLRYHDENSTATDSLALRLSERKLKRLQPQLYGWRSMVQPVRFGRYVMRARDLRTMIVEHMSFGDSRAAIVVRLKPLLVAAYTDEQDAILLLRFPDELATVYKLAVESRLLTVNTYADGSQLAIDIVEGERSTGQWTDFYPIIAEFVSDDLDLIEGRKRRISEAEWQRTSELSLDYISRFKLYARSGLPLESASPASVLE